MLTEDECLNRDGQFQGPGSDCSADRDSDGMPDACDGCPDDPGKQDPGACGCGNEDVDTDGDGEPDCIEDDRDGDGWSDASDCVNSDPNVYPGAPEINDGQDNQCPADPGYGLVDEISGESGFRGAPVDKETYSWPPQTGATAYDVVRADDPGLSVGCVNQQTTAAEWVDPEVPGPGSAFFYGVRAASPFVGSWGADSVGQERTPPCAPPP